MINLVIGLGDSETGDTGDAGLKAGDGRTGIFGLFTGLLTGDTIPDFFAFAAFAAAHFRNNRAFTSFSDVQKIISLEFWIKKTLKRPLYMDKIVSKEANLNLSRILNINIKRLRLDGEGVNIKRFQEKYNQNF